MEKKLQQLFDYQKFANNEELSEIIAMCDYSSDKTEKNENSDEKKPKGKILSLYRSSILTMAGSAVAASLLIVLNVILTTDTWIYTPGTEIGSMFTQENAGYISAGVVLCLGAVVSYLLYRKKRK